MNRIEKTSIEIAVKSGFTFAGDSFFSSYRQAKRALSALVRRGYLTAVANDYGTQYEPTQAAADFVQYGITTGVPRA